MLQTQTVGPELLELIKALMEIDLFQNFYLVGGTALALQIGHRQSVDIDLFGQSEIDEIEFTEAIKAFGEAKILKKSKNILIYTINGIKVDFVNYPYPWIAEGKATDTIRLAAIEDIAAMKLNAIAGRGSKKDFIDLFFILKEYSLTELLSFYSQKYSDGSPFLVLKSLAYFADAERQVMPVMYDSTSWATMKEAIKKEVLELS